MSKAKKTLQLFRDYSAYILWLVGVLLIFANLYIASQLNPINQNLEVMAQKVDNIESKVESVENQHNNFVQKDTFNGLVERLNHISERVDSIYSIVATR